MAPFLIVYFFALVDSSKIRFETAADREHFTHGSTPKPTDSRGRTREAPRRPQSSPSSRRDGKRPAKKRAVSQIAVSANGEITSTEDPEETNHQESGESDARDVQISVYDQPTPNEDEDREPHAAVQQESNQVLQELSETSQHRQLENGEHTHANHHKSHMQQTMRIEESEDPDTLVESGSLVSTKHRHRDVNAPVLGGVIGGVLVVALIMLAYKRYSEMRIRHRTQDLRSPTPSSATPPSPREVERQNDRTPSKPERPTKIDYAAVRSRK